MAEDGPLQLSLFDQQDLAEITSEDFPGERLVACRNPVLAADRARKREDLLAATEKLLAPLIARVPAGRLAGAAAIGVEVGKVISKYKTGKHFEVTITDDSLAVTRGRTRSTPKPPWTGSTCCAPPSPPPSWTAPPWSPPTRTSNTSSGTSATSKPTTWTCGRCSTGWKNASGARADLHARLLPHLAPAPGLGAIDLHRREPAPAGNPVAPARRSAAAQAKASRQHDPAGRPYPASAACSSTWPP